ncbi:PTS sugar transporter subunit IIA [Virgibacillus necropolis]|uniref:PTS mannose transporter subunit IIAB n=1 Tax=Virgibacillus necropolis TaxID=163877 RepID=A0A221M9G6_9BACI|nr:PTS sugar transporter subunit IIA [Virgibacillus necropolis]ASN04296.1 PTS mannose transporter subunit IIAB [Virgibacillus necropolis]
MTEIDIINEDLIELNNCAPSKRDVLEDVARMVYQEGRVRDKEGYLNGLLEREANSTTGFGDGIAIPHAKIDGVIKPTIAVIKLKNPVEWEAMDNKPVKLIISLAVPSNQKGTLHLKLLANLSEHLMEDDFKRKLILADTKREIYKIITSIFYNAEERK